MLWLSGECLSEIFQFLSKKLSKSKLIIKPPPVRSIYLFCRADSNHLLQKVQQVADSNRNGKEVFITVFYMTWKLFYCYFSSYIYKNRIWYLWNFFLKIIFPSYIYNYMFCIYSFDFFKKNTDPQLMMFTPSKFLSNMFWRFETKGSVKKSWRQIFFNVKN